MTSEEFKTGKKVGRPKGVRSRDHVLSLEEVELMYDACEDEYDRLFLVCAVDLGMRAGEIAAMRRGWLNHLDEGIDIPPKDVGFKVKTTAGARPIAAKELSPRAWNVIVQFFKRRDHVDRSYSTVYNRLRVLGMKCNLYVFPNCLRATCATNLGAKKGSQPILIAQIMGWERIDSASPYIRMTMAMQKAALRGE